MLSWQQQAQLLQQLLMQCPQAAAREAPMSADVAALSDSLQAAHLWHKLAALQMPKQHGHISSRSVLQPLLFLRHQPHRSLAALRSCTFGTQYDSLGTSFRGRHLNRAARCSSRQNAHSSSISGLTEWPLPMGVSMAGIMARLVQPESAYIALTVNNDRCTAELSKLI